MRRRFPPNTNSFAPDAPCICPAISSGGQVALGQYGRGKFSDRFSCVPDQRLTGQCGSLAELYAILRESPRQRPDNNRSQPPVQLKCLSSTNCGNSMSPTILSAVEYTREKQSERRKAKIRNRRCGWSSDLGTADFGVRLKVPELLSWRANLTPSSPSDVRYVVGSGRTASH